MLARRWGWRGVLRTAIGRDDRGPRPAAAPLGPAPPGPAPPGAPAPSHVGLDQVRMAYGNRCVFDSLSCRFPAGRISVVLGGSGSGKSTILRLIGGLIRPAAGRVWVEGEEVSRLGEGGLRRLRSTLGMLFQGGALLDSWTVFENLALPLREHRCGGKDEIAAEVHAALAAVGVVGVDDLLPGQLSGGMLRRVALARAIIRKPRILLCDEPFSGLDPVSIKRTEALLVGLNRQFGMTVIVVSHHIPSTFRMAEEVLLLLEGRAVRGSPAELRQSDDPEVSEFLNEEWDRPAPSRSGA